MNKNPKIKLVFIGGYDTGKTMFCKLLKIGYEHINFGEYISTPGGAYMEKKLIYNNQNYLFDIWDTGGQQRYAELTKIFYRNADIIFVFFNSHDRKSFERAKNDIESVKIVCENKNVVYILVENKYDLNINSIENENIIYDEEISEYIEENNIIFSHLSLLENYSNGFNELFIKAIKEYNKKKKQ